MEKSIIRKLSEEQREALAHILKSQNREEDILKSISNLSQEKQEALATFLQED